MINQLLDVQEKRELVSVYVNLDEQEHFAVGYVMKVLEEQVLLLNVGLHGDFDGYTAIYISDIYRIERESQYLKKIKDLCLFDISDVFKIEDDNTPILSVINTSIKKKIVIKLLLLSSNNVIVGYITDINDYSINILQVDDYGYTDGYTVVKYEDIVQICIGDLDCRDVDILYHKNKVTEDK